MKRWAVVVWMAMQAGCGSAVTVAPREDGGGLNDLATFDLPDASPAVDVGTADRSSTGQDGAGFDAADVAVPTDSVLPAEGTDAGSRDGSIATTDAPDGSASLRDAALDLPDASPSSSPRLIAPLAGARVTQQRPTFRWALPADGGGVRVEVCVDRGCAHVEQSWETTVAAGRPTSAPSAGVHFWRVSALAGSATSAVWPFAVPSHSGTADTSWNAFTDFNGDGRSDVLVLTRESDAGSTITFRAHLGHADGFPVPGPALTVEGGARARSVGDLDGDGYGDLAVGRACVEPGVDHVEIHRGGPDGPSLVPWQSISWPPATCDAGRRFVGVGDVNGDGYGDLLVESPVRAMVPGGFGARIELYLGGPSDRPLTESTPLEGGNEYNGFGEPTALGDVNGDGFADAAAVMRVGFTMGGAIFPARVLVYFGSTAGLLASSVVTLTSPVLADTGYGQLPDAPVDLDGNGYADIVVSDGWQPAATGPMPSRLDLHPGWPAGASAPPAVTILTPWASSLTGASALSAGDFDGDGFDDLAVLATLHDGVAVQVFRGGNLDTPSNSILPNCDLGALGGARADDLDADGRDDLIVSLSGSGAGAPTLDRSIDILSGGGSPITMVRWVWLDSPPSSGLTLAQ